MIINGFVLNLGYDKAFINWAPYIVAMNILFICTAAYMGRILLTLGNLQHLTNYHFKFAYNLNEGIVTI